MKAKVKESRKDINIDIVIENNLLSKNKMLPPVDESNDNTKPEEARPAVKKTLNDNTSRLLSDYYGIIAARNLYNENRSQPFNLNQYFQPHNLNRPTEHQPENVPADAADEPEIEPAVPFVATEYAILTPEEDEDYMNNELTPQQRTQRNRFISNLKTNPNYRIRKEAVRRWKLAGKVQQHRPDIWARIVNGTWPY